MTRLPVVSGRELVRVLEKTGYEVDRQKGSTARGTDIQGSDAPGPREAYCSQTPSRRSFASSSASLNGTVSSSTL